MKKHIWFQRSFALLILALIFVSIHAAKNSAVAMALARGERIPLLLFGLDAADASRHTDTLMIAVLSPNERFLNMLSVPRDTRVRIPGYRFRRVNEIYGYHFRKSKDVRYSSLKVLEGLETLLSQKSMKIHLPYFIQVDYSGFADFVDLLGGIWVTVKQPMHYDDFAGGYHFHKDPGRYKLSGMEALRYVRFRGKTGDRGRILRQQEFLRNMAKRFVNPIRVLKLPELGGVVASSLTSNLTFWDMVFLSLEARRIRSYRMGFHILPGRARGPYWRVQKKAALPLLSKMFYGKSQGPSLVPMIRPLEAKVTVQIWNASGKRGLARRVTTYLRKGGFDVVGWGNYPINQVPTRIIDRSGNIGKAKAVAEILGVENFHSELNSRKMVNVEVVLGKNYSGMMAH